MCARHWPKFVSMLFKSDSIVINYIFAGAICDKPQSVVNYLASLFFCCDSSNDPIEPRLTIAVASNMQVTEHESLFAELR